MDLDAFFCSVEELHDPSLIGKPFAVGGSPDHRGVVSSCSYAARMLGVRSAMPTGKAKSLCPQIILISGHHSDYSTYSDRVMSILREYSPLVEVLSIDEAFIDISDLPQSSEMVARLIQQRVRAEVHLPCSIGGATSKLVAKIATDAGKAGIKTGFAPCAINVIPPGAEKAFLAPLSVNAIWGVGPKMTSRLNELGIRYIGDLTAMDPKHLESLIGNTAGYLLRAANGLDDSAVEVEHGIKSISQETTFDQDVKDDVELERTIRWLTEKVSRRLREKQLCASTVRLKIRLSDFSTFTRQERLDSPTNLESIILNSAITLFHAFHQPGQAIRLIGVGVSGLGESWHQMDLFQPHTEKEMRLMQAMDELQQKFGRAAIQRGKIKKHG